MNEIVTKVNEERAHPARSSLRQFLFIPAFLVIGALLAPAAYAAGTPALTGTNPTSPGASTTPRIRGGADGVITSAVRPQADGPIASALEPGNTITIYTVPTCTGSVAATGTAEELEGAGIPVTVPADSETTFYATQTAFGVPSGCSNGITYQQVTTPPAAPVFGVVAPVSPANDNYPRLSGSVAAKSIVSIYSDSSCSALVASGPAATFSGEGIQVHVADNSTTGFHAVATLAGISSGCSSSTISYQEVTPAGEPGNGGTGPATPPSSNGAAKPPPPRLRTIPGGIANDVTPLITGSAPQAALVKVFGTPDCSGPVLARGSAAQLAAGLPVQIVPNTSVAFYGRSVDSDGDQSACSDPAVYTDDSIAPRTRITAGPGVKTLKRTVVFRFADITDGPDTRFLCKVDRKPWKSCRAPLKLKKLGYRRHVLRVKAFDAAGNREKHPVKRSFQVVSHP